jgi:DNA-binding transcriptional regulator YiaG
VFVYGFGKNERDNIRDDELTEFKRLAALLLSYRDTQLRVAVTTGLVSQWERGEKHPQGASLKLLALVARNGLEAVA